VPTSPGNGLSALPGREARIELHTWAGLASPGKSPARPARGPNPIGVTAPEPHFPPTCSLFVSPVKSPPPPFLPCRRRPPPPPPRQEPPHPRRDPPPPPRCRPAPSLSLISSTSSARARTRSRACQASGAFLAPELALPPCPRQAPSLHPSPRPRASLQAPPSPQTLRRRRVLDEPHRSNHHPNHTPRSRRLPGPLHRAALACDGQRRPGKRLYGQRRPAPPWSAPPRPWPDRDLIAFW
jgi:hypothetical protein